MDYIINGGIRLSGSISIESAKNSVLPILAAAALIEDNVVIEKCPDISDVRDMAGILRDLGVKAEFGEKSAEINGKGCIKTEFSEEIAAKVRTSVLMLGALCGRAGSARIPLPGGCDIGARPIDIHIKAFRDLGADVYAENGKVICRSKIAGGKTVLPFPSVGATENVMIGAALSSGETVVYNAAKEPEIVDLANFLNASGARISGAGTSVIKIEGVKRLCGVRFCASPDRIETGTYLIAAAITGGEVELRGVKSENISTLIGKLCENTCKVIVKNDIIYLRSGRNRKGFSVSTGPYPMFPTDLQPQATALAAVSEGVSVITERVFRNRFYHAHELCRMGANIRVRGASARVTGVSGLHGAEVYAHDLRCGASLVVAGLNAEGTTVVKDVVHLERGYSEMDKKLLSLGAEIEKRDRV